LLCYFKSGDYFLLLHHAPWLPLIVKLLFVLLFSQPRESRVNIGEGVEKRN